MKIRKNCCSFSFAKLMHSYVLESRAKSDQMSMRRAFGVEKVDAGSVLRAYLLKRVDLEELESVHVKKSDEEAIVGGSPTNRLVDANKEMIKELRVQGLSERIAREPCLLGAVVENRDPRWRGHRAL